MASNKLIMDKYVPYDNQNLPGRVRTDIANIKSILMYPVKEIIYFRSDKYYFEFIFPKYHYSKKSYIYLTKIFKKMQSSIRIGWTENRKLIITIERWPGMFMNELEIEKENV